MKDEIKAGIIIVGSIAILSVFIILIGGIQFLEKFDTYSVKVMNAAGLEPGAQVKLGGVRVGRVLAVNPPVKPGEPVSIKIGINKGTVLYKGTKALITQIGFVGDIYLLLSINDTTNEIIQAGDTIPSEEKMQMDVLMAKLNGLSESVDRLITDIDKLFNEKNLKNVEALIGNTNSAVVSGTANLEKIAAGLKSTTDKLEQVLGEIEEVVKVNKGEVSILVKKAREDIERAGEMIRSIESTAKSVEKTSKTADRTIEYQSRNIENLIGAMTRTTEELQDLLQEIKQKPWSVIYKEKRGD
jgi:phospholipid/cholesterol/gamma-HCH transport system substrate-binding protein